MKIHHSTIRTLAAATLTAGLCLPNAWAGNGPGPGGPSDWSQAADIGADLFAGAAVCSECHNGIYDNQGQDVSIETAWSASMMANAVRDPVWRAKVASEIQRNPAYTDTLNEKCSRCHAPMANVEAHYDGSEPFLFGEGWLNPENPYHALADEGVSCTLCHQIAPDSTLGTPEGFSGHFTILTYADPLDRPAYGQYAAPSIEPMRKTADFTPTFSAHATDSALCASCHNLETPVIDTSGELVAGAGFQEQAVYTEWQYSSFAEGDELKHCQDCHMQRTDGVQIANRPLSLGSRDGFARHDLTGANTAMLTLLASNQDQVGTETVDFDDAIAASRALLNSAASLEIASAVRIDNQLSVELDVRNHTGHKLPTSYPSRRLYLHLTVSNAQGRILFESGQTRADGSIVGVDADTAGDAFESHHDLITSAEQVQVYEPIAGNVDGEVTYTLLNSAAFLKDNRLLPLGFDKATVPDEVKVQGAAQTDDDFVGGSDRVSYLIPVSRPGPLEIVAELRYQPLSYGFLQDLWQDDNLEPVAAFRAQWEANEVKGETLAVASTSLQ